MPYHAFVNIKESARLVLETVLLLGQKYGLTYISRMLTGSHAYIQDMAHRGLKTYASLSMVPLLQVQSLILYLLRTHYLQVTQVHLGSLAITCKGEEFLDHPKDLIVKVRELEISPFDTYLQKELRQLQKDWVLAERLSDVAAFSDYSLFRLVEAKPKDLDELKMVPGFGDYHVNRYGPAILACIQRAVKQGIDIYHKQLGHQTKMSFSQEATVPYNSNSKLYISSFTSYWDQIEIDSEP